MKDSFINFIKIRGAKVHNLKNINVDIPKNRFVVITGVSGSGKSSLAFDILYAEGQRRYVESLSVYARQFLGVMQRPNVDKIEGISPAIAIDQRKAAHNPRSTVGTMTEIYDYLRLLFSKIGIPHCPRCGKKIYRQNVNQITERILTSTFFVPKKRKEIVILGPMICGEKGEHREILEEIRKRGFIRVRIDGILYRIEEALKKTLDREKKHDIEVVVDRLILDKDLDKPRLVDSIETGLKLGKGTVIVSQLKKSTGVEKVNSKDLLFSEHFACEECGISLPAIEPRFFSFNSPYGACSSCQGLGTKLEIDPKLVMPNLNLAISEGAIFPRSYVYSGQWLTLLAKKHNFSLDEPVKNFSKKILNFILYGDDSYEGVIPNLEQKYHKTDSEYIRQEIRQYMVEKTCEQCMGKRLKQEALAVKVSGKSIDQIVNFSISQVREFFENGHHLSEAQLKIGAAIIKEIINRLQLLIDVGLNYLTLSRRAGTLAAGEEQRIRLVHQIGAKLTGVLYVLDEPSIGLHARDQNRLIETFKKLRDSGNTIVVIEHDYSIILAADWVIDIGPGAGKQGGRVIFEGTPKELLKSRTLTGDYLAGRKKVEISQKPQLKAQTGRFAPCNCSAIKKNFLIIKRAAEHNLKNIDVKIPLGKLVCITGVSGSGKSSLMNDILARALLKKFYNAKDEPGRHKEILGTKHLNKIVLVDQLPIGRTPKSNPATYTGAFSYIRELFSQTKEAKIRNYGPGRFSFNVKGGRCENCEGQGVKRVEMYFLPDVYVECQECKGRRYNKETLEIEFFGKNIDEVLQMTVKEASKFFKNIPALFVKLKTLDDVGLGYIQLGQPAPSLSGGEAQRIKLATELSKKATGKTLYILDEPTTGLHADDIKKLIWVLRSLVDKGNTVLVCEHNIDIIRNSDWGIDLGPEGGDNGGYIVAEGTPLEISKNRKSYTGQYLKQVLTNRS